MSHPRSHRQNSHNRNKSRNAPRFRPKNATASAQAPTASAGDASLAAAGEPELEFCQECRKPIPICLCSELTAISHRVPILILQHPQEPDVWLGTAPLLPKLLTRCSLRTGLSWPNLNKASGKNANPKKWIVLYLGSGLKSKETLQPSTGGPKLIEVTSKGERNLSPLPASEVEGIVLLDGTWSQAKTLWWRNAWLLKLRRAILVPAHRSLYGKLRKEPKRDCLSTLESTAEVLDWLGEPAQSSERLRSSMKLMLDRFQSLNVD